MTLQTGRKAGPGTRLFCGETERLMEVLIPGSDNIRFILQQDNVSSGGEDESKGRKDWAACRI